MPSVIGNIHDNIIKRIAKGGDEKVMHSFRTQFGSSKKGFIFPLKIYLNVYFDHSIDELLFSSFIMKIQNSYEYIILNKGGWINGISSGFFSFFQDTLGYQSLSLDDFKHSNIVLYSSIMLQYIANYDIEGRGLSNINAIHSFRLCIP